MYMYSLWYFMKTCAHLQVKAAVLDPDNDFNVERTLTKDDVQKLIQVHVHDNSIMTGELLYKSLPSD